MSRKPVDIDIEPLVVRPVVARRLLGDCSEETLWRLINDGTLESYRQGGARLITVASIKGYIALRLASPSTKKETPRRRRVAGTA